MNYKEQLKNPKWQKKRLEILNRDNFKCTWCGDKETTLHVHHNYYMKNKKVWEYENYILTTLCEGCHKTLHDSKHSFNTDRFHFICNKISDLRNGMDYEYADKYYFYLCNINYDDLFYIPLSWTIDLDERDITDNDFDILDVLESAICNRIKIKNFGYYIMNCLMFGKLVTAKEIAKDNNEIRMELNR